jgi:hypothetical protein
MNPNYGYQLYQAQRIKTRAEILAEDARLGRQAAAASRGSRGLARRGRASAIMARNAITGLAAGHTARVPHEAA